MEGPAGGAGLVTVLVSEGGGIEGGKGAAWLVAGLAVDDDGAEGRHRFVLTAALYLMNTLI